MEKVSAWDIAVVLCAVSKDQPATIPSLSFLPPLTLCFVQQLWKIKSSCKPAFCFLLASWQRGPGPGVPEPYSCMCIAAYPSVAYAICQSPKLAEERIHLK